LIYDKQVSATEMSNFEEMIQLATTLITL